MLRSRTPLALRPTLVASVRTCVTTVRARKRRDERVDSVDEIILADRELHSLRIEEEPVDSGVLAHIRSLHLGRRKRWHSQKAVQWRRNSLVETLGAQSVLLGRTGLGMRQDWDRLNREGLPEVLLFGHSNCGKSALLNALAGEPARKGPAEVNPRAGWTAELGFYRIHPKAAKREGALVQGVVLVDSPGYGFAVGSSRQLKAWGALLADYMDHSPRLRLAVMLIDSTRGLCLADRRVLKRVAATSVPLLGVLTKVDLLDEADLAASHAIVTEQMADAAAEAGAHLRPPLLMLSSHFCTGVGHAWTAVLRELAAIENERSEREAEEA